MFTRRPPRVEPGASDVERSDGVLPGGPTDRQPQTPARENALKVVWALAWPAVVLNSLQVVNNLLDTGFVGQLDQASTVAYGGVMPIGFFFFSIGFALATAATAMVSRAFGAGDADGCRTACRKVLGVTAVLGLVAAFAMVAAARPASHLMLPDADGDAGRLMVGYLILYAIGLPAHYVILTLAGSLRGIGDTRSPMVISGMQIVLHIALNYILIFPSHTLGGVTIPGFDLGLAGAGASITISAWFSASVYLLFVTRTPLGRQWNLSWPEAPWVRRVMSVSVPAAMMSLLRVASLTAFMLVLRYVPDSEAAISAVRPAFSIESMMFMPAFGLSAAAAALVGQSLGMRRPDRAEKLGWVAAHSSAVVTLLLCAPIFLFAQPIMDVMLPGKPEAAHQAALLLQWLCVTEVGFSYAMVLIGAMQGAGDTVRPLWITIFSLWVLRVPLAWALAIPFGFGAQGAWAAMSISQFIQGILAVWIFRQGRWKLREV
ncbi:MAG: MATE family efflux transporter [Fimbriimonadaceae bacterium]